jgi:hypothetical protein
MEVSSHLQAPGKEPTVDIEWEAGSAPEPVLTLWDKEKSLYPIGNRTLAMQTESLRVVVKGLATLFYSPVWRMLPLWLF